jgi:hypothetical protein
MGKTKGATLMKDQLPRINKAVLVVTHLGDDSEEKQYWLSDLSKLGF